MMFLRRVLEGVEISPSSRETVGTGLPGGRKDQRSFILSFIAELDHTESGEKFGKTAQSGGLRGHSEGWRTCA